MDFEDIPFDPSLQDVDRGIQIYSLAATFSVLIILTTGTRLAYRLTHHRTLGVDDVFIFIGLAFNLTANMLEVASYHAGYGRHLQFLTTEQKSRVRQLTLYIIFISNIALWAIKMSISFFLLKLIAGTHGKLSLSIYVLMFMTSAGTLAEFVVWLLQASPLEKAWHPQIPGTVGSPLRLLIAHVVSQVLGSIVALFYALSPIYFLTPLQMSRRKKAFLLFLTGCGLIDFSFAISHVAFVKNFFNPDFSWALHILFILALFERNLAEIIASLPVLAPLVRA